MSKAAELASLASASETALSNRNIVINGGMQIWQRATTFSVSDNIYTTDRWLTEFVNFGAWTLSRSTDVPDGFGYSMDLDCTTADASPAAGDVFQLFHRIEGQNLQQLKKGISSSEPVTLSFWVKSKKTGNLQVNLRDANSRIIGAVYTISVADTWEYKSIIFTGDTSGTIANDNSTELTIEFMIGSGSTYTSGAVPTSWEATNNADRNAGATINLADSTANYWRITGVQLEVGTVATPFEHRSVGQELALCQRYYHEIHPKINAVTVRGYNSSGAVVGARFQNPVTMRTEPSCVVKGTFAVSNMAQPAFQTFDTSGCTLGSATSSAADSYFYPNGTDDYFTLDAEL